MMTFVPLVINQQWDVVPSCHAYMTYTQTANWGACHVLVTEVSYCCTPLGRKGRHFYNIFYSYSLFWASDELMIWCQGQDLNNAALPTTSLSYNIVEKFPGYNRILRMFLEL